MRDPTTPSPQANNPADAAGRRLGELDNRVAQLQLRVTVLEDLVDGLLRLCGLPEQELMVWRTEALKIDAHAYRLQSSGNKLVQRLEERNEDRRRRAAHRDHPPR